jgi:hypothetical protein
MNDDDTARLGNFAELILALGRQLPPSERRCPDGYSSRSKRNEVYYKESRFVCAGSIRGELSSLQQLQQNITSVGEKRVRTTRSGRSRRESCTPLSHSAGTRKSPEIAHGLESDPTRNHGQSGNDRFHDRDPASHRERTCRPPSARSDLGRQCRNLYRRAALFASRGDVSMVCRIAMSFGPQTDPVITIARPGLSDCV